MTSIEIEELRRLVNKLGEEIEGTPEELREYLPDSGEENNIRDFYLPRIPKNFYYDPRVFRKLLGIV
jgi:hypothetical protein